MNTSFYSLTAEIGRRVFSALARADREDAPVSADPADGMTVWLFVAIGLLVAPAFFILGAEIARVLVAFG
jgi:hypothetical protein